MENVSLMLKNCFVFITRQRAVIVDACEIRTASNEAIDF
jgi:hypothetical protein